jgi:cobalt-zinc-cadmium efflux system outer membrane protein
VSFRTHLAVAACVLFAAVTATAQELSSSATRAALRDAQLESLVAEALAKAPEMASAQASVEAAQRRTEPARTLADPFLSTSYQNDGRAISFGEAEGSFLGLMASQAIPWPGKLRLAGEIAASQAREIERGTLSRTALTLEARVRNVWYDLILARAIDRIIDDRHEAASQIEESVRERYAAGLAVQQDVLRAQVELARLDELKATQAATIVSRLAELNRLVGAPQDRPVVTPDRLPTEAAVPSLADVIAAAAARSPEAAATQQATETGRLTVDLAKKNFLPDFTVNAGSMYRGSFEMGPMWQVGVGINIPLWIERRQQNQLAEAQAVVRGRTADNDTVLRELELRTRERMAQLEAALRIATLYREKVLPLDDVSLESALASYQAGKLPFISVLDALNTLYSDRAIYASRLAESAKWRVAIDEASLQPTSMSSGPSMGSSSSGMQSGGAATAAPSSGSSNSSMNSMR